MRTPSITIKGRLRFLGIWLGNQIGGCHGIQKNLLCKVREWENKREQNRTFDCTTTQQGTVLFFSLIFLHIILCCIDSIGIFGIIWNFRLWRRRFLYFMAGKSDSPLDYDWNAAKRNRYWRFQILLHQIVWKNCIDAKYNSFSHYLELFAAKIRLNSLKHTVFPAVFHLEGIKLLWPAERVKIFAINVTK